jgi:hypothetical protein
MVAGILDYVVLGNAIPKTAMAAILSGLGGLICRKKCRKTGVAADHRRQKCLANRTAGMAEEDANCQQR